MGVTYTAEQIKKMGLIMVDGKFVKASSQVEKGKVEKLPPMRSGVEHMGGYKKGMYKKETTEPSENRKVKNATKTIVDNITFHSKLESYFYGLLKGAGLTFEMQKEYELQPKFEYKGEKIRAIKSYVDFFLPTKNMIVDCKGYANDIAPMKFKMLKFCLHLEETHGFEIPGLTIEMPATKKDCDMLLNKLLYQP